MNVGLVARIESKPEYASQVEELLRGALKLAKEEEQTVAWFAFREGPTTFGIFDTFADDEGRAAHLSGQIAAALMGVADTMLAAPPEIRQVDVLGAKVP
ncbi:antibiotic biosynthesis monooxygenase [Streptomyces sp. NPDC051133]|uniref:putative quinol monooxygenase n=1 Tax=Streptomyces sp. NPDC051133 TaxID=3155521 RepID=UPI003423EDB0